MKKQRTVLIAAAAVLLLAMAAAAFWYYRPFIAGLTAPEKTPYGGIVKKYNSRLVDIAGVNLPSFPSGDMLAKDFRRFMKTDVFRMSGYVSPPGMLPLPFVLQISEVQQPDGTRKIEFRAEDKDRRLELKGLCSLAAKTLNAEISGKISDRELAVLGVDSGRIHGSVAFSGHMNIDGQGGVLTDIDGYWSRNSWLEMGTLRLSNPGRFEFRREPDGKWNIQFPDAVFDFPDFSLSKTGFSSGKDNSVLVRAALNLAGSGRIQPSLPLTGSWDMKSGAWSFEASASGAVSLNTDTLQMQLSMLKLAGQGNADGGTVSSEAEGRAFVFSPSGDSAAPWRGANFRLRRVRKLAIPSPGRILTQNEELNLNCEKLNLTYGNKSIKLLAPEISVSGTGNHESLQKATFKVAAMTAGEGDDVLNIDNLAGKCAYLLNGDNIIILEKLSATARKIVFDSAFVRAGMSDAVISGNIDRLSRNQDDNLSFAAEGKNVRVKRGDRIALSGERGRWQLTAGIDRGASQPEAWKHRLCLTGGQGAYAPLDGNFDSAEIDFETAASDMLLRRCKLFLKGFAGKLHHGAARNIWQIALPELDFEMSRKLTGWRGILKLTGNIGCSALGVSMSDIGLVLPFEPESAPEPGQGSLVIGKFTAPDRLADSLRAELSATDMNLTCRGTTTSALLSGGGFFFNGQMRHSGGGLFFSADYSLPETTLAEKIKIESLGNTGIKGFYQGKLGAAGSLRFTPDGFENSVTYIVNGNAELASVTVKGVKGEVSNKKPSSVSFSGISSSVQSAGSGRMQFMLSNQVALLQKAEFDFSGGVAELAAPVKISFGEPVSFELDVHGITPDALLPLPPGCKAGQNYAGKVGGIWSGDRADFLTAVLNNGFGHLNLSGLEKFRYIPPAGINEDLRGFAASALADFSARQISLQMRKNGKKRDVRIKAEGNPGHELPYVYDNGVFRRQQDGEFGFSGNVTVSSDYRITD